MWTGGPYGRTLHFGIREHAMGSIMNGITLHGGTRVYGGTFMVFSDYMRPAGPSRRPDADCPSTYVWTHDSIGLGEDGPTHQPIEQLAALRAIPGLDVVRPADANETAVCLAPVLENTDRPAGLASPVRSCPVIEAAKVVDACKGAYVLAEASSGLPEVIIIATGSEVSPRHRGRARAPRGRGLADAGGVDAVRSNGSAPRSGPIRTSSAARTFEARVSVEAGVALGWREIVGGDSGEIVSPSITTAPARPVRSCSSNSDSPPTTSSPPPTPLSSGAVRSMGAKTGS